MDTQKGKKNNLQDNIFDTTEMQKSSLIIYHTQPALEEPEVS